MPLTCRDFLTQNEAFDKAKQLGLTPDQAARDVTQTPHGRFTLYDVQKDEIVKPDTWKPPDFRSLTQAVGTEAGKSELSCVLDDTRSAVMARPMILSEETPTFGLHFAHCVATLVQTDDVVDKSTPDELAQTIDSHLWARQSGDIIWHCPGNVYHIPHSRGIHILMAQPL